MNREWGIRGFGYPFFVHDAFGGEFFGKFCTAASRLTISGGLKGPQISEVFPQRTRIFRRKLQKRVGDRVGC
ncbi:hypothetical protein DBR11_22080 [Pedobacter sp. HMWF019]|nr:hypothetical protein DBR11_22080 [Pedobacter sp. HMWF019]